MSCDSALTCVAPDSTLAWLATAEGAARVWGVYSRLLGLVFLIAHAPLVRDLRGLCGSDGITPARAALAAARRDFGLRALWWWPTVLHASASDAALLALPLAGAAGGAAGAFVGGAAGRAGLALAWAAMLSIDSVNSFVYPWDSLLLEAGFLALFLPATAPGGAPWLASAAGGPPAPLLQFAHRWLLLRLLVGFGKFKFVGSGWADRMYIKTFLLTQPLVTPAGALLYRALPDAAWPVLLLGMFVSECVLPFALVASAGTPRLAAAASIVALMAGIQLTGNFGYFNVLTSVLSLSGAVLGGAGAPSNASLSFTLADVFPAPALAAGSLPAAAAAAPAHALFGALYLAVLLPLSLVQFIMNSWISMGWAHWPVVRRLRGASPAADALLVAPARAVAGLQRALVQLRLVHAYGVFPPTVAPPQRWTVCFETSDDGRRWARLRYAHQTSSPASAPSFVAPWHPRLDHAVFYESTGMNGQNLLAPLGHHSPLSFPASSTAWSRVQARLLQGSPSVRALFADPPPAGAPPPRFVRAVLCEFSPAPAADAARGVHWREVVAGVHLPPASLASIQAASLGVPGGGLLPFADAAPAGVHDYWCESAVWAGRALAASGPPRPPTDDELDALWRFLDFVRAAAVEAAAAGTGAWRKAGRDGGGGILVVGGGGGEGGQPGGGRSTAAPGTVRRRSGSGAAAAAAPPRGSPRAQPPARATAPAAAAAAAPAARPPVSELSDAACALGAPAEAYHAGLPARSLAEARAIYTWRALPAVVDAVRRLYTPGALVALRHTLGRVALPLLRASDAAFGRAPPPAAGARDAAAAAAAAELRELIEGTPPDVSVPRDGEFDAAGVPAARARATAHVFRGNDDADARGAAANPLRWLAHAHVLALVGGRAGVRAVHEGLAAAAGAPAGGVASRAFYERLAAAGGAGARERGALLRALSAGASGAGERVRHGDVPTESGLFLAFLLHYDVVVAHAEGAARTAAQARPPPAHGAVRPRAEDAPTFLPAALAVLPRLLAHHRVLRRAGGGGPPPARPAWAFDEPEGRWERVRPTQSRVE